MRLTDLDQTIFIPLMDEAEGTTYEVQMTLGEFLYKFLDEFQPEVVDAIPVEWIRSLMLDGWPDDSKAAWRVLKAWKEEQEAR